jgi:hypothetical protein
MTGTIMDRKKSLHRCISENENAYKSLAVVSLSFNHMVITSAEFIVTLGEIHE